MMDWEAIIKAESSEELKEAKLWLFQENMRLEQERTRQEKEKADLECAKDKFIRERNSFKTEMNILNRKSLLERKRLKEENLFFDKKMAILQNGFRQLDLDRKAFEVEKIRFQKEKELYQQQQSAGYYSSDLTALVPILFRNATNPLTLRKRYKDLIKIFHPDNIAGDEELVQIINREFSRRRREEA